jgi:hypothetical protein
MKQKIVTLDGKIEKSFNNFSRSRRMHLFKENAAPVGYGYIVRYQYTVYFIAIAKSIDKSG